MTFRVIPLLDLSISIRNLLDETKAISIPEKKADKRAIDFMVNAGYNPVAMIVMMNKTFAQDRYEFLATHPLASRRMAYVYEYIFFKYPEFLKNNKYQDNIYYQNFLLTSQENRRKLQRKVETRSKSNVNYD